MNQGLILLERTPSEPDDRRQKYASRDAEQQQWMLQLAEEVPEPHDALFRPWSSLQAHSVSRPPAALGDCLLRRLFRF